MAATVEGQGGCGSTVSARVGDGWEGSLGLAVDLVLGLKAALFVGNPGSGLSANVVAARAESGRPSSFGLGEVTDQWLV